MKYCLGVFRSVRALLAILTFWCLLPTASLAATDVSTGLGGNEPTTAAVNPLSPNMIAVARGLSVAISTDFGVTFPTTVPMPNTAPNPPIPAGFVGVVAWQGCGDPSVTFDSQGQLFMSYLLCGLDNAVPANILGYAVFVQQVNAATGATVGNPVLVSGNAAINFDDKEWIVADATPDSPFQDNLYVVWTRLVAPWQVMFSRSTDGGANWSAPTQISAGGEGNVWPSHIATAPNGDIYVTYHGDTCGSSTAQMFVLRDSNGGAQLQAGAGFQKTSFTSAVTCNYQGALATIAANTQFWMQGANQGFVIPDPVRPGQIYVVVNDSPPSRLTEAYWSSSRLPAALVSPRRVSHHVITRLPSWSLAPVG